MPEPNVRRGLAAALLALVALAGNPVAASEPPRLMGIVIAGQERIALFAGDPTLLVHEGDPVGDERVTAIGARTVQLDGPSGPRVVQPSAAASYRAAERSLATPPPSIDVYRREREIENDQ